MLIILSSLLWLASQAPSTSLSWTQALSQPAPWYASAEAGRIAGTVRLYQRESGGWPKNLDMAKPLTDTERATVAAERRTADSTIDNGATVQQIRYLARVHAANRDTRDRDAIVAGIDYLLEAQYPNGGWPQYFPLRPGYWSHITYNDSAMVNVMTLLDDIVTGDRWSIVDAPRVARAREALQRAIALTLQLQIRVNGRLTGWCQQYDETTKEPANARAYEHPSIASMETVGIVRFLMTVSPPHDHAAARTAIDGAVEWLRRSEIHGSRLERRPNPAGPQGYDQVVVADPAAPALWARFSDIATNRPIFSGRDGVIKNALADIEIERRTGYSWLGTYAASLLAKEYPAWVARQPGRRPGTVQ